MTMTDPIADMLTRIRNANTAYHETCDVPVSKMKLSIAQIMKNEGYIADYSVKEEGAKKTMTITLKYQGKERVISGLKKISKPGLKKFAGSDAIPRVLGGLGVAILSTSSGVITGKEAKAKGVGGEVICYIW
jgi:small subunit ribosomal protein S8